MYSFLKGLEPWAQLELQRQGVKDLPSALVEANALLDLWASRADDGQGKSQNKAKEKQSKPKNKDAPQGKTDKDKGKSKVAEDDSNPRKGLHTHPGYFLGSSPHRAKDCLNKEGKVKALVD